MKFPRRQFLHLAAGTAALFGSSAIGTGATLPETVANKVSPLVFSRCIRITHLRIVSKTGNPKIFKIPALAEAQGDIDIRAGRGTTRGS
jgi:hypothetical protein